MSLALVIGRDGGEIDSAVVGLDVVRRDVPDQQAVLARSYATHTPLGAHRVAWSELRRLGRLRMRLAVDGECRQDASTADLVADADVLVASVARRVRLGEGDIILAGTPPGLAFDRGEGWLRSGSELVATIEGVGELHTVVGDESSPNPTTSADMRRTFVTGTNYDSHVQEMGGGSRPSVPSANLMKFADAVCENGDDVPVPADALVDYEGEIAVVIGAAAHRIDPADVDAVVAGLCLANDVTARDAPTTHLVLAKNAPRFCPLGPLVDLPAADLDEVTFTVRVNGEVRQFGDARDMVHSIRDVVASYAQSIPLEPGDVVLTGSPAGVGVARHPPAFLHPGDTVEIESPQLGRLANRFVSSSASTDDRAGRSERS